MATEILQDLPATTAYLALSGDLGAGKTHFVKGLARALGVMQPVTSPTFNIYSLYEGTRQLIHIDAYRLQNTDQLDDLLLDEFMKPGAIIAVEWSENVPDFFPAATTFISIETISPSERRIVVGK